MIDRSSTLKKSDSAPKKNVFTHMASSNAKLLEKKTVLTEEKGSTLTGLVWNTNMAAVLLFWNTNMADSTSCENVTDIQS